MIKIMIETYHYLSEDEKEFLKLIAPQRKTKDRKYIYLIWNKYERVKYQNSKGVTKEMIPHLNENGKWNEDQTNKMYIIQEKLMNHFEKELNKF